MSPLPDLAGRLLLRPGPARAGQPTIQSTRPAGLQRVALGRGADELPALMAALHALCAHAHRLAARLAVRAALGEGGQPSADERLRLQAGTARDQVLRLAHDWPRLLPGAMASADPADQAARALRSCPLWRPELSTGEQLAALSDWLQHHWLGQSPASWLAAWAEQPQAWAAQWAKRRHTPLARLMDSQGVARAALATAVRPWLPLARPLQTLPALSAALALAGGGDTTAAPDTGPWSRQHAAVAAPAHNAWMRLVSRLVDLLQLAGPDGRDWLAAGAASAAPGEGLAWVETARGLLVHRVLLDDRAAADGGPRVRQFQLLAPTDLNFHPHGVLAEALQALPERDTIAATRLAVAFDPCVVFEVAAGQGAFHA